MRFILLAMFLAPAARADDLPLDKIHLPNGFKIEVLARVPNARAMTLGAKGTLFVGSRDAGVVSAVTPDGKVLTIATDLNTPGGVAFHDGDLYVSAVDRILKFPGIENNLQHPPKPIVIAKNLPTEMHHGLRFIGFGPEGKLYVSIGAPCNICEPGDPYAAVLRMNADGSHREIFARGIRDSVGFDWHPVTHELWFTDNGRDMLGDDLPPDELNRAPKAGLHFGYPYCHGGYILDPDYGKGKNCANYTPPEQKLGPHVASLGMRFYTGRQFPKVYFHQIFIAEHGSWNRSKKIGYRISLVELGTNGHPVSYKPFAEGWLQGEEAWGRPVDVLVARDGSLLVSDDKAGAVYRIRYTTSAAKKRASGN